MQKSSAGLITGGYHKFEALTSLFWLILPLAFYAIKNKNTEITNKNAKRARSEGT
ncbi:hypothetical protein [Pectobacterium aroidearum]|jgi:hypothetical protein|uniref:hypothetical protein n=1 Tax=Pectobacterium aroidearum TaxID=1201031 RepID=UPI0015DF9B26|nr:hypothetical protein [Pectobacterium aroidearum]MBA0204944.1 hypothetical protein [Pectobacterium aroidearum]